MRILEIDKLPLTEFNATVITIGNFDGVHAGHRKLINTAVERAQQQKIKSVVMTFHPHPALYFNPDLLPLPITSKHYKEKLIKSLNVDALLTLTFNKQLAELSPEEYFKSILLKKLNGKLICVGYDFTFGKNRSGNVRSIIELAEKYHIEASILQPQRIMDHVVSSTKIREHILKGEVEIAANLLARQHIVKGKVISGDKDGRQLGFPTINIDSVEGLIPATGIYSGIALINSKKYAAAIYIGTKPTYGRKNTRLEAHLLDFSGNLYSKTVSLAFLKFVRKEIKYDNLEDLKSAIQKDCHATRLHFEQFGSNGIDNIIWP